MYIIKRVADGMWLMAYREGGCGAPTCLWGEHRRDAMPFDGMAKALKTAKRIGDCMIYTGGGEMVEHGAANTRHRRA